MISVRGAVNVFTDLLVIKAPLGEYVFSHFSSYLYPM